MKLSSGHFESNAGPILEVLKAELPAAAEVLEVASGYGQHAAYFAKELPDSRWQPSDINQEYFDSMRAYGEEAVGANMSPPLLIDASGEWPVEQVDAVVCINLLHVSATPACSGVLRNAGRILSSGGLLMFYGPFIRENIETAPSNLMFDMRLKQRDPEWGIPDLSRVEEEAADYGLRLKKVYELPSNNVMVVMIKD
ncbi:DUF938 domain-containing protein [Motiliproteus sp. MSK22-1]|uniref:DUF938 domain-containing protein n=1 Tax=Motiliproteus sp. MSK22-1 TaxID=1897630 RepID=UPI000977E36D|nr:DUF938 domain-containing protein [Motiliproteus sp. MSK22-1]OMH33794.1 hypothetical protein BGP75_12450 [Motiliproteus sp. MSK22-1]